MKTGDKKGRGFGYGSDGDAGAGLGKALDEAGSDIADMIKEKRKKALKDKAGKDGKDDKKEDDGKGQKKEKKNFFQALLSR